MNIFVTIFITYKDGKQAKFEVSPETADHILNSLKSNYIIFDLLVENYAKGIERYRAAINTAEVKCIEEIYNSKEDGENSEQTNI